MGPVLLQCSLSKLEQKWDILFFLFFFFIVIWQKISPHHMPPLVSAPSLLTSLPLFLAHLLCLALHHLSSSCFPPFKSPFSFTPPSFHTLLSFSSSISVSLFLPLPPNQRHLPGFCSSITIADKENGTLKGIQAAIHYCNSLWRTAFWENESVIPVKEMSINVWVCESGDIVTYNTVKAA